VLDLKMLWEAAAILTSSVMAQLYNTLKYKMKKNKQMNKMIPRGLLLSPAKVVRLDRIVFHSLGCRRRIKHSKQRHHHHKLAWNDKLIFGNTANKIIVKIPFT
jgi:hypothetical protein